MLHCLIDILKLVEGDWLYGGPQPAAPTVASQPPLSQFLSPVNVTSQNSSFQPLATPTQISSSEPSFTESSELPFQAQFSAAHISSPQVLPPQPPAISSHTPSMSSSDPVEKEWEFGEYCSFLSGQSLWLTTAIDTY